MTLTKSSPKLHSKETIFVGMTVSIDLLTGHKGQESRVSSGKSTKLVTGGVSRYLV